MWHLSFNNVLLHVKQQHNTSLSQAYSSTRPFTAISRSSNPAQDLFLSLAATSNSKNVPLNFSKNHFICHHTACPWLLNHHAEVGHPFIAASNIRAATNILFSLLVLVTSHFALTSSHNKPRTKMYSKK